MCLLHVPFVIRDFRVKKIFIKEYKLIIALSIIITSSITGILLMNLNDMLKICGFAIMFSIQGIMLLPVTSKLFEQLCDGGWLVSKTLGLYFGGWLVWLLSSLHVVKFTSVSCLVTMCLIFVVIYCVCLYEDINRISFVQYIKIKAGDILLIEAAFFSIFVLFSWYLGHKIPSHETERLMDFAIMSALNRTEYMPPEDMWAAGGLLNYYYFGQYIITYLGKLLFTTPQYSYTLGFNLIIPVLFMGIFVLAGSITDSLVTKHKKLWATIAGLISAISVTFSSNMHYFVFYILNKWFGNVFNLPVEIPDYWFANSSRYIGYWPENISDRTIIEFPIYSFLIGDLHAHVINMMLVVSVLMTGLCYMLTKETRSGGDTKSQLWIRHILSPYVIIIGFILGISSMSNSWDLPIYFVVCGSLFLFTNIHSSIKQGFIITLVQGIIIGGIVFLVALPFNMKFEAMINGIGIVETRSLFHQLVIVWGYPVVLVGFYVISCFVKKVINTQEIFVFLIGLCAVGLAIMPEFIYARDIYENGYPRANTMFKLSYEAFILFGLCAGIIIVKFINDRNRLFNAVAVVGFACFLLCSGYFITAGRQWIGNVFSGDVKYLGIDAVYSFRNENSLELEAIEFLEEYVETAKKKRPRVLEADGDSYTNSCRVSVLTGFPTIMGWNTHEWLWLDSYEKMAERKQNANDVYTGIDPVNTRQILDSYDIDYVFIGEKEYARYGIVQNGIIESLGNVIYSNINPDGTYTEIVEIIR